ncbi:MAG: glycosyltransferase, partial [Dermatophilaceae bacterium]
MARYLMATLPITGHVHPGLPIVRELTSRGHEVRWYTGARFRRPVEAAGARFEAMTDAVDFDDLQLDRDFPGRVPLRGVAKLRWDLKHIFLDAGPGQVSDLERIVESFAPDVVVHDVAFVGVRLLHERRPVPYATYNPGVLAISSRDVAPFGLGIAPSATAVGRVRNRVIKWGIDTFVFRDVTAHYNDIRVALGLPPFEGASFLDEGPSPYLFLQPTIPSFEYPRSDLPPQVHFIGPFRPDTPADFIPPAWWPELTAGRKVVYVTQGTLATDAGQLIAPTLKALAHEDVLVVATTGGKSVDTVGLDPLPANARVEPFVPHGHLMPHVGVMVTNGGYGGVQHALAHGVP